jgi:hypothetical protein
MANPDIANQNRRRAASWPVFKLGITMEELSRFLMVVTFMIQGQLDIHWAARLHYRATLLIRVSYTDLNGGEHACRSGPKGMVRRSSIAGCSEGDTLFHEMKQTDGGSFVSQRC